MLQKKQKKNKTLFLLSWSCWDKKKPPSLLLSSTPFFATNTTHFISAITTQTASSLGKLSSPITFISTSNLISPKERKANKQRKVERQKEKERLSCPFVWVWNRNRMAVFFFPPFFHVFLLLLLSSLFLYPFFLRKKAFKGAIVGSSWSGLLVSGRQGNTTNMAGTNQGPG